MIRWLRAALQRPIVPYSARDRPSEMSEMPTERNVSSRTLFIGNNIDFLRGINSDSIDLIYSDPPHTLKRAYEVLLGGELKIGDLGDFQALDQEEWILLDEIERRSASTYDIINAARLGHSQDMAAYLTFMGARLIEMERVLKRNGSVYLHCRPDASHYLKALMDSTFGADQFISEVIWKGRTVHGRATKWGLSHDVILFYSGREGHVWNRFYLQYPREYWEKYYRYKDSRGRFQLVTLTSPGVRSGLAGSEWRRVNPSDVGRHWAVPQRLLQDEYPGRTGLKRLSPQDKLELLDEAGLIHWPVDGNIPRYKLYSHAVRGIPLQDVITDIDSIPVRSRERTQWPTQKPLALLERIISASSDPGDLVLDPFCGAGTTCLAAEKLERDWIGVEVSPGAADVLSRRMQRELSAAQRDRLVSGVGLRVISKPPVRTDLSSSGQSTERGTDTDGMNRLKNLLYDYQNRKCNGCGYEVPMHLLRLDQCGSDVRLDRNPIGSQQLLCHTCNRLKNLLYDYQNRKCNGCGYEVPMHLLRLDQCGSDVRLDRNPIGSQQLLCHTCNSIKGRQDMNYLELQLYKRGILRS